MAIMQAEKAFKNFFNHKTGFPKFKKKHEQNINKSYRVKKLKKKIKRMQRRLSKKILKKRGEKSVTTFANIDKCKLKLQKLYV